MLSLTSWYEVAQCSPPYNFLRHWENKMKLLKVEKAAMLPDKYLTKKYFLRIMFAKNTYKYMQKYKKETNRRNSIWLKSWIIVSLSLKKIYLKTKQNTWTLMVKSMWSKYS